MGALSPSPSQQWLRWSSKYLLCGLWMTVELERLVMLDSESFEMGFRQRSERPAFVALSVVAHAAHQKQRSCRSSVERPQQKALRRCINGFCGDLNADLSRSLRCCGNPSIRCCRPTTRHASCGDWSSILYIRLQARCKVGLTKIAYELNCCTRAASECSLCEVRESSLTVEVDS